MKPKPFKSRRNRRASLLSPVPPAYRPILRLWVLRLIQMGGGLFADRRSRPDITPDALEAAGLKSLVNRSHREDKIWQESAQATFMKALREADSPGISFPGSTILARNLEWLGEAAGLSQVDRDILHFVILSCHHTGLENALDQIGSLSMTGLQALLCRVLDLSPKTVARSLDHSGMLARTGLLQVDGSMNYNFRNKVELLNGLSDRMTIKHADEWSLFQNAFVIGQRAKIELARFPQISKDLAILSPFLRKAIRSRRKGVNILIHGTPGTGKTELVRSFAADLGVNLFEVASERPDGGPIQGWERFRGYRLAQSVLEGRGQNLVFFDEIEDVFRLREDGPRSNQANASGVKAWVNKVLEENPVPAFWVTNHLEILDPAFIRRFDYILRLDNPPRSVRRQMLEDHLADLPVDDVRKTRLSEHEGLSPALISKAAEVVRTVRAGSKGLDDGKVLSQVLENALEALGHSRSPRQAVEVVTDYRPELVNTDCDLDPVLNGLRMHGNGRLCFYGPPGTGKTAYGRHVAQKLDRPLLVKRASDLLSMWVGGTEKLLAAMFEEARNERAVLLLDEADSFLQDRGKAQRSWEVTQVNEMLTQMEAFEGIFIASTNLMDQFDTAALRRFDVKVRFDYLRQEQAWIMFQDAAARLGIETEPVMKGSLAHLGNLTPGDFATVLRQARLNRPKDARQLLNRLEAECQVKPDHRRKPIGFSERAS